MYFYSAQIRGHEPVSVSNQRNALLQNTVTRSLADDISQHQTRCT